MTDSNPKTFLDVAAGVIGEKKVAEIMNRPFESMIERVARGIYETNALILKREDPDALAGRPLVWADVREEDLPAYLEIARAALAAIREPTHRMISSGGFASYFEDQKPAPGEVKATSIYRAMIDAALKEP